MKLRNVAKNSKHYTPFLMPIHILSHCRKFICRTQRPHSGAKCPPAIPAPSCCPPSDMMPFFNYTSSLSQVFMAQSLQRSISTSGPPSNGYLYPPMHSHVHVDIVRPLPPSRCYSYLLNTSTDHRDGRRLSHGRNHGRRMRANLYARLGGALRHAAGHHLQSWLTIYLHYLDPPHPDPRLQNSQDYFLPSQVEWTRRAVPPLKLMSSNSMRPPVRQGLDCGLILGASLTPHHPQA